MASSVAASIPAYQTTILGCPLTSILNLYSTCSGSNIPTCVTATADPNFGVDCCSSLYSYGSSLAACYSAHAPECLDTTAYFSSLTAATATASNICAAYTPGSGSGPASGGSQTTGAAATATGTAAGAATTGSTTGNASPSATGKSAAPKIGAGLKVYVGAALIGALAILSL